MIEGYRFGQMLVAGQVYMADLKIVGGQVVRRWWRGEAHRVSVMDLEDVFFAQPECLVVGTGQPGRMHVESSCREALAEAGIRLVEEPTEVAVLAFNELHAKGKKVAGAFHLTC